MKQVMQSVKNTASDGFLNLYVLLKGVLVGYISSLILFAVFAVILNFTSFPERMIPTVVMITVVISVLIAGSNAAGACKSKGWLNGGIVGLLYLLLLYLISGIALANFEMNTQMVTTLVAALLAGALGGIIGINLRKGGSKKFR